MSYQTLPEVKKAAKTSKKAAIKSSIRHWKELSTAPPKDLINANDTTSELYPSYHQCAMCVRYACSTCPLEEAGFYCLEENSLYTQAADEFSNICFLKECKAEKDAAVKRFRRRAKKMIKVLESLLEN